MILITIMLCVGGSCGVSGPTLCPIYKPTPPEYKAFKQTYPPMTGRCMWVVLCCVGHCTGTGSQCMKPFIAVPIVTATGAQKLCFLRLILALCALLFTQLWWFKQVQKMSWFQIILLPKNCFFSDWIHVVVIIVITEGCFLDSTINADLQVIVRQHSQIIL